MTHLSVYSLPLNCFSEMSHNILFTGPLTHILICNYFQQISGPFRIFSACCYIHVHKLTDASRIRFYSVLDAFNLMQLVSAPTHKDHNTLDLVIVPSDSTPVTDLTVLPVVPSDHFPILLYLKLMTTPR